MDNSGVLKGDGEGNSNGSLGSGLGSSSETNLNGYLKGKKALIVGVANERSLAWGIAEALHREGAELGFNYLDSRMEKRVRPLAESVGATLIAPCDVSQDAQIDQFMEQVKTTWGSFDILVHSVAFANKEDLERRFIETSRDGFRVALDISAYSLIALCRAAEPLMNERGTVLTLSYHGAHKIIPYYNIMGVAKAALESAVRYLSMDLGAKKICINTISAGPVRTLAAAGIKDFRGKLNRAEEASALNETVTPEDVGYFAAFLCGPGGRHITGTTLYVDSGIHTLGM